MKNEFTLESVRKAMREAVCRGYEGHAPLLDYTGTYYEPDWDGQIYSRFTAVICEKCRALIYIDVQKLDVVQNPLPMLTPPWPP
jgi:hypothetical protein